MLLLVLVILLAGSVSGEYWECSVASTQEVESCTEQGISYPCYPGDTYGGRVTCNDLGNGNWTKVTHDCTCACASGSDCGSGNWECGCYAGDDDYLCCECPSPYTECGTECVDTDTDDDHCGNCNAACGTNAVCDGSGNCECSPSTYQACDGSMRDIDGCECNSLEIYCADEGFGPDICAECTQPSHCTGYREYCDSNYHCKECIDTDGGVDIYTRGTVYHGRNTAIGTYTSTDFCNPTNAYHIEERCASDGTVYSQGYHCPSDQCDGDVCYKECDHDGDCPRGLGVDPEQEHVCVDDRCVECRDDGDCSDTSLFGDCKMCNTSTNTCVNAPRGSDINRPPTMHCRGDGTAVPCLNNFPDDQVEYCPYDNGAWLTDALGSYTGDPSCFTCDSNDQCQPKPTGAACDADDIYGIGNVCDGLQWCQLCLPGTDTDGDGIDDGCDSSNDICKERCDCEDLQLPDPRQPYGSSGCVDDPGDCIVCEPPNYIVQEADVSDYECYEQACVEGSIVSLSCKDSALGTKHDLDSDPENEADAECADDPIEPTCTCLEHECSYLGDGICDWRLNECNYSNQMEDDAECKDSTSSTIGECCGDGICQPWEGEDLFASDGSGVICVDCKPDPDDPCVLDGVCNVSGGETCHNCEDCQTAYYRNNIFSFFTVDNPDLWCCGNDVCEIEYDENYAICPRDCNQIDPNCVMQDEANMDFLTFYIFGAWSRSTAQFKEHHQTGEWGGPDDGDGDTGYISQPHPENIQPDSWNWTDEEFCGTEGVVDAAFSAGEDVEDYTNLCVGCYVDLGKRVFYDNESDLCEECEIFSDPNVWNDTVPQDYDYSSIGTKMIQYYPWVRVNLLEYESGISHGSLDDCPGTDNENPFTCTPYMNVHCTDYRLVDFHFEKREVDCTVDVPVDEGTCCGDDLMWDNPDWSKDFCYNCRLGENGGSTGTGGSSTRMWGMEDDMINSSPIGYYSWSAEIDHPDFASPVSVGWHCPEDYRIYMGHGFTDQFTISYSAAEFDVSALVQDENYDPVSGFYEIDFQDNTLCQYGYYECCGDDDRAGDPESNDCGNMILEEEGLCWNSHAAYDPSYSSLSHGEDISGLVDASGPQWYFTRSDDIQGKVIDLSCSGRSNWKVNPFYRDQDVDIYSDGNYHVCDKSTFSVEQMFQWGQLSDVAMMQEGSNLRIIAFFIQPAFNEYYYYETVVPSDFEERVDDPWNENRVVDFDWELHPMSRQDDLLIASPPGSTRTYYEDLDDFHSYGASDGFVYSIDRSEHHIRWLWNDPAINLGSGDSYPHPSRVFAMSTLYEAGTAPIVFMYAQNNITFRYNGNWNGNTMGYPSYNHPEAPQIGLHTTKGAEMYRLDDMARWYIFNEDYYHYADINVSTRNSMLNDIQNESLEWRRLSYQRWSPVEGQHRAFGVSTMPRFKGALDNPDNISSLMCSHSTIGSSLELRGGDADSTLPELLACEGDALDIGGTSFGGSMASSDQAQPYFGAYKESEGPYGRFHENEDLIVRGIYFQEFFKGGKYDFYDADALAYIPDGGIGMCGDDCLLFAKEEKIYTYQGDGKFDEYTNDDTIQAMTFIPAGGLMPGFPSDDMIFGVEGDPTGISIDLIAPSDGSSLGTGPFNFTFKAKDDDGTIDSCVIHWEGESLGAGSQTITSVPEDVPIYHEESLANGKYDWWVECQDNATNTRESDTWTFYKGCCILGESQIGGCIIC